MSWLLRTQRMLGGLERGIFLKRSIEKDAPAWCSSPVSNLFAHLLQRQKEMTDAVGVPLRGTWMLSVRTWKANGCSSSSEPIAQRFVACKAARLFVPPEPLTGKSLASFGAPMLSVSTDSILAGVPAWGRSNSPWQGPCQIAAVCTELCSLFRSPALFGLLSRATSAAAISQEEVS